MHYTFCIVKVQDKYYLEGMRDKGKIVIAANTETPKEVAASVERQYNRKHDSSYEGSMSACIHYLTYQYSFFSEDENKLVDALFPNKDNVECVSISHVSGFLVGFKIENREVAESYFSKGVQPRLISE